MQPDATGIKYQVFSIHKYINAKCFLVNKKCGFFNFFSSTVMLVGSTMHIWGTKLKKLQNYKNTIKIN